MAIVGIGLLLPGLGPACQTVENDRITAGDLATGLQEFAAIPAATALAYSPVPGAQRIYRVPELNRLAARYNLALKGPVEICFERPMHTLQREELAAAMHRVPGFGDARIETVEFSRGAVPHGEIHFERLGLAGKLWKGYISYGEKRKFAIWARVEIAVRRDRVVAAEALPAGQPIRESQVRLEMYEGPPRLMEDAGTLERVVGRLPRRSIAAGAPVALSLLEEAKDVVRGDLIDVEVHSGAARISLTARAETSGRLGDRVSVRNLKSGRTFWARVEGKGKVIVQ